MTTHVSPRMAPAGGSLPPGPPEHPPLFCDERFALLQSDRDEAFKRADKMYLRAWVTSCALPSILLPACALAHLPWPAYVSVCGTISGIVFLLFRAHSGATLWAETCARKLQDYALSKVTVRFFD